MKRKVIYLGAVLACAMFLVAFNQVQPQRLTAATLEKSAEVQAKLGQLPEQLVVAQAPAPAPAAPAQPAPAAPAAPAPAAPAQKDPNVFKVKFECSNGDFVVEVHRDWAPIGAARFEELVKAGFYNENRFFRVVPGFVVQFGLSGDPGTNSKWRTNTIKDEPVKETNAAGTLTFAKTGAPNSRTTQLFINLVNNERLDDMGFSPFGKVIEGMDVVRKITAKYKELPDQGMIQTKGNEYLKSSFPDMDFIKTATIIE